jgi:hypothetical protein
MLKQVVMVFLRIFISGKLGILCIGLYIKCKVKAVALLNGESPATDVAMSRLDYGGGEFFRMERV